MSRPELLNPSVVRQAGMLERWHIVRQNLGMLGAVVISGKYTQADGRSLDKAILYPALNKVIQKHSFLAVCVSGEKTEGPVFVRLNEVDLSNIVTFSDGELAEVLNSEISQGFETSLPLWRAIVLRDGTVAFSFHHAIGDGQSGLCLHRTLLTALNETEEASSPNPLVTVASNFTLLPPLEEAANLAVSPFRLLYEILKKFIPTSWTAAYWTWAGYPVPTEVSLTGRVRLLYHSPEAARRILRVCRAHSTSLTPVIHTLATLIISELLSKDPSNAEKYRHVSTCIPISLRSLVGAPPDAMCNYVSVMQQYSPLIKRTPSTDKSWLREFPWDRASELTRTLREQQTAFAENVGILKYARSYEDHLKRGLGNMREVTFEVSNVGRFPSAPAGSGTPDASGETTLTPRWNLEDVYFIQSNPVSGPAIHINVSGDPAGGVGYSVTWPEGAIDDSFGEAFFEALKVGLEGIIHHEVA